MLIINLLLDILAILLDFLIFVIWLLGYPFYLIYIHLKEAFRKK